MQVVESWIMDGNSHTDIFIDYYQRGFWANASGSSGPNSAFDLTPVLRRNLQGLLQQLVIGSILDAGCGDANLFRHIDLEGRDYNGLDCVPQMIASNQARFAGQANMRFNVADVVTATLPQADLILCRDVVHYLPTQLIWRFLRNCVATGSRYLLITHNTHAPLSANSATEVGIFRPVNLSQQPFNLPVPILTIQEDVFAKELALWELTSIRDRLPPSA